MLLKIDILGHEINPGTKAYQTVVFVFHSKYTQIFIFYTLTK